MSVITIFGAGDLGGSLAHTLASKDLCTTIKLIDPSHDIAMGKALDISQAGPIESFRTQVVAEADPTAVKSARFVILTNPAAGPEVEWDKTFGAKQLRQINEINSQAIIICAGSEHSELIELGVTETMIDPERLIGSAPEAYRAAVRALVALEVNCPASAVSLTLFGRAPDRFVVVWSQATINGSLLEDQISASHMARLRDRVAALWPPGPYALAEAATHVVRCIATGNKKMPCCFVTLKTFSSSRPRVFVSPVAFNSAGITHLATPSLNIRERNLLETAMTD
tara:strand:+ start:2095 stop:2943 length:849 start_codon:yes stop_codon:yes gene_type:complete